MAELKADHPELDAELVRGGGGVFDVEIDGRLVFSKHQAGRFPNPGEVASLITS